MQKVTVSLNRLFHKEYYLGSNLLPVVSRVYFSRRITRFVFNQIQNIGLPLTNINHL